MSHRREFVEFTIALQAVSLNLTEAEVKVAWEDVVDKMPAYILCECVKYMREAREMADTLLMLNSSKGN